MYISEKWHRKSQKFLYKTFHYYVLYNRVFSLIQCLLVSMLFLLRAPCPMQCPLIFKPETIMVYYTSEGLLLQGHGEKEILIRVWWSVYDFFPLLMLPFEILHVTFSNIHLEKSLRVMLLFKITIWGFPVTVLLKGL